MAACGGVNLLKQTPYDLRSVIVSERIVIDFDELRAVEAARLEALAANAVFSKMCALAMLRLHVGHLTDGMLPLLGSAAFTCDAPHPSPKLLVLGTPWCMHGSV